MAQAISLLGLTRWAQRRVLLLRLLVVLGLSLGCRAEPAAGRERGVVIAVEAQSLARADRFTLRTDDGREIGFRVAAGVDWTPGHLREHAVFGEPVVVEWRREAAELVAVRVADAVGERH